MARDAIERTRAGVFCPLLLGLLDLLPVRPNLIHVLHLHVPKNVRMAADELIGDVTGDLFKIKRPAFARQLTMENHLQKQITQLLFHQGVVAILNGLHQFIDLFHRVKAKRAVRLLAIPRAAIGRAESSHHGQ